MAKMMDIPPIDSPTFWGAIVAVVSAPFIWFHNRLSKLESEYVTKQEFSKTIDDLRDQSEQQTQYIREDIKQVNQSLNIINQHLLSRKE